MKRRKVASLLLASALAVTLLSGCSKTNTDIVTETKQSPAMAQVQVMTETQIVEPETYPPYQHVFFQRFYVGEVYTEDIKGGQILVPEGYEILDIEQVNKKSGYGSRTGGFDVWFINTKTVEVQPVYNEALGYYDYSEPGTVIEQELEQEGPTLKLTP